MTAIEQTPDALRRLIKRSQFQRAARGNRAGRSAFGLQVIAADEAAPGIGFTVTKKTGNSPERNRIKRRLRAAVTACARDFVPHHDYVLVGRREALTEPFTKLVDDLGALIVRVHKPRSPDERASPGRGPRKPR
ncbi:ribonuclease P protein component [Devosia sp. YR412]|uniref:ribonuclease P protein component n=1 Tax=Devosia sp. YR412 TaxID=1881030 RepID=UPI0008BF0EA3|nr:ribonuclease P protein component [Devosia sp. YR412]SEP68159.1 ribonuclease P protein component [Devosia sp. YR412]